MTAFEIAWNSHKAGERFLRRLTTPLGREVWSRTAARQMGWAEDRTLRYYDSDDVCLGGFVPNVRD